MKVINTTSTVTAQSEYPPREMDESKTVIAANGEDNKPSPKSPDASLKKAPPQPLDSSPKIHSFDMIASIMLHMWHTFPGDTSLHRGHAKSVTSSDNIQTLHLDPDASRPDSMEIFVSKGVQNFNLNAKVLEDWYPRMVLGWSCSNLVCGFIQEFVPLLRRSGITELILPDGDIVYLSSPSLGVFRVNFFPDSPLHSVSTPFGIPFGIELNSPIIPTASHDVLQFGDKIVDLAGGQFRGVFVPKYFSSQAEFLNSLPGKVKNFRRLDDRSVYGQPLKLDLDILKSCLRIVSEKVPLAICRWCMGKAPKLRCVQCRNAFYCGKLCQKRDWKKRHKLRCSKDVYW